MRELTQNESELVSGGASEGEFMSTLQSLIFAPFLIGYLSMAAFFTGLYVVGQTKSTE